MLLNATKYDKDKAEKRLHILKGLIVAIDKIDEVIALIKKSESKNEANSNLRVLLNVDEIQANAILDMKLAKLTRIDKNELIADKEHQEEIIIHCDRVINEKSYRNSILISQISSLRSSYGDARRTKLDNLSVEKTEKEIEFVEPEKCVVVLTESGLVKRIPSSSFRNQHRNTKGVKTQDDITSMVIRTNTIDSLMIFTDKGKMYRLLVNDIPVGTNVSKGQSIKSLITMDINEQPTVIYSIYRDTDAKFVLFTTKNGVVKKTPLDEYIKTQKRTGIAAINIREDDELVSVNLIKDENILFVTSGGYSMRIKAEDISISSRIAIGYKGITLHSDDSVVAALPIRNNEDSLAIFSTNGMGKKFPVSECPVQNRGGKGLICYKPTNSSGLIAAATLISDEDNILICGDKTSLCISATEIPSLGRVSIGNQLIKGSSIVSVSKV